MSRKFLIIAVVVAVLLATLAAPAMGATPKVRNATPAQTEAWYQTTDSPDTLLVRAKPRGGSQSGGGGGCTI